MTDQNTIAERRAHLTRILPMYVAAYAVLLCGLASYITTDGDDTFGARGVIVVMCGLAVSLFCRVRQLKQNTMFGVLAGMVAVILFYVSLSGGTPVGQLMSYVTNGRSAGPGLMLAWFLMLYSFAMIADEVIIFSVVPSIALLGLMASENLNPEIVVYFVGLILSAAFLLVYENSLSRLPVTTNEEASENPRVKSALLLAVIVLSLAMLVGLGVAIPLQVIGKSISDRTLAASAGAPSEFTAETSSRYINQLQLSGAPPRLSDRVVMKIRTPEPFYWRGKVFEYYTGSSWSGDQGGHPPLVQPDGSLSMRILDADPERGEARARRLVRQFVTLRDAPIAGMLVSAGEPARLQTGLPVIEDTYRDLRATGGRAGAEYVVDSLVPTPSDGQLQRAGLGFPPGLRQTYIQLNHDEDRGERYALATRITERFDTQFEKVKALQRYLQENYTYSLTPPRTPPSEDAVMFFLTQSKEGYCEIFASALAVLCRELNIPARLATGFAPGEWRPDPRHPGEGVCVVREKDLHAWTEVYFPGYGWVPFDPTSSRDADTSFGSTMRDFLRGLFSRFSQRSFFQLLVLLSISGTMFFLVKSYGWDPMRASVWWRALWANRWKNGRRDERWDLLYARAHTRVRRWAGPKRSHQTPYEYAQQARPALTSEAAQALQDITAVYVNGAYRPNGPDESDIRRLLNHEAALRHALKSRQPA
ncbi:MAG TPA: transglutaminaseTgpA domain-containing protein [Armatimonadota bacterium]|jgi:hypothetical protein